MQTEYSQRFFAHPRSIVCFLSFGETFNGFHRCWHYRQRPRRPHGRSNICPPTAHRNSGTAHIHTVPGWEHKDPQTFRDTSRKQIEQNYDTIRFIDIGVAAVEKKGDVGFEIVDEKGERWGVRKVVLAIGSSDVLPEIEGYKDLWKKKM